MHKKDCMKKILVLIFPLLWLSSCGSDENIDDNQDLFDRGKMLANWADNIIIPSYHNYTSEVGEMLIATDQFIQDPTTTSLMQLREKWQDAYMAWQHVAMFEIGRAEAIGLQGFTNTYPTDSQGILDLITSGNYNLELPSRRNQQGFPAVDFLINGIASSDPNIVAIYSNTDTGTDYKKYLGDVVLRINTLAQDVLEDWNTGYRDTFVANNGSSATGAVNKMTNDFLFYFEKHLRAAKIGIPAGVFSGTPAREKVEAYYQHELSGPLFQEALNASQNFFNGRHFNSNGHGDGFSTYLTFLNSFKGGEDLSALINDQFDNARNTASVLPESLADQIDQDNTLLLNTYDELQKNVVLMKVDMLQSLNIRVDYVDADGD